MTKFFEKYNEKYDAVKSKYSEYLGYGSLVDNTTTFLGKMSRGLIDHHVTNVKKASNGLLRGNLIGAICHFVIAAAHLAVLVQVALPLYIGAHIAIQLAIHALMLAEMLYEGGKSLAARQTNQTDAPQPF